MRRIPRLLALMGVGVAALTLSSCSSKNISTFGYDKSASSINSISNPLWTWAWIAAGVVGVITAVLIMWPVFFHRKKNDA